MKIINRIPLLILFTFTVASCSPRASTPTTATNALLEPTHIVAPTGTNIPVPSSTPTLSQVEEIFTIPTMGSVLGSTPTPIATPSLEDSSLKLKELSEKESLALIYAMNEYSYQNYPPFSGWWTEGEFVSSQMPVALAIQEYLYHFPESPSADRLRWQLAFIDSITFEGVMGNEYNDKWMVGELQKGLNRGDVPPDELQSIIDKYWFDVNYFQPVENLFGDGKTAWFYVISPKVWKQEGDYEKSTDFFQRGGLFIVVRKINDGDFQLHLLENAWSFSNGASSLFEISDRNKNGVPEIALNLWLHSGSMCGGNFKIFEWRDSIFVDLTRGEIQIGDCVDNYEYSDVEGKPSIIFRKFFRQIPAVYTWNGSYYEFSGYEHSTLIEKWLSARSYSEESETIEEILSSENTEGLSPSHIDFLRYRLGIVYALDSQVSQVKRVLQDLAENPLDKTRTVYSEFARNFLRSYSGDESLYLACEESREIFDAISKSLPTKNDEELFGIPFDFTFGPGILRCFDQDVFEVLINKIHIGVENLPGELRKNGMDLYYAEKQDINLDGVSEEWLIIFNDSVFVVVPSGSHFKAVVINYFESGENVKEDSKAELNIERWNGIQDPVMTISANQELSILSIGEDYSSTWLNAEYDVEDVLFSSQDTPAQYQAFYIKPRSDSDYYDVPWKGYRWDSDHQVFRDDLVEYMLFIEHNPDKTVEIAKIIIPLLIDWKDLDSAMIWLPRYFYLCGLSYELSGDAQKATEVYSQLWHDFPSSHYALLAKYKLEPVTP